MNRTLLYYPTINIPNNSWLKHALLYWDDVASIVPKNYDEEILTKLSPEVHYLIDQGLFRAIKPMTLIEGNHWSEVQNFIKEFQEVVDSEEFTELRQRGRYRSSGLKLHRNKVIPHEFYRIHSNKTSYGIFDFLAEKGLASQKAGDEWIQMESTTALLYMSLLAKYLADIDSEHTTIGTDNKAYEGLNFKRVEGENGFPVTSLNLSNILPTPKSNVPLERIISFKRDRVDNLRNFRLSISKFQRDIAKAKSNAELKEIAINFQDELVGGVKDLTDVLSDSRIDFAFKTMKTLINPDSMTAKAIGGTLLNQHFDLVRIPIEIQALGLVGIAGFELSTKIIEQRNHQRAELRNSPFSYLYYAGRSGIIPRN